MGTMAEQEKKKRLFFGWEVDAPWPHEYPGGRLLNEECRHMTFAFLGNTDYSQIQTMLPSFPAPNFTVGFTGQFDHCLFLPERHPRVAAWHIDWFNFSNSLLQFQQSLLKWLQSYDFSPDYRPFLPHVTICRAPFCPRQWKKAFLPLPCLIKDFHLFESLGNLHYQSLWKYSVRPPFEEIEHTADIAFQIHAESFYQLQHHAQMALAFRFPPILPYLPQAGDIDRLDQLITALNAIVTRVDGEIGCPFKAISFHGDLVKHEDKTLQWEMIVDV